MNRKKALGVLLAGALSLSLLPMAAQGADSSYARDRITETWETNIMLQTAQEDLGPLSAPGLPEDYKLLPSSYDEEHYRLAEAHYGEDGGFTTEYDSQGNLVKLIDDSSVSNRTETWTYDSQGRETRHTDKLVFTDSETGEKEVIWDTVTETAYNEKGQVSQETQTSDGETVVSVYAYDDQGRVTEEQIQSEGAPGVETYTYEGDKLVKDVYVGDGSSYETVYTYEGDKLTGKTVTLYSGGEDTPTTTTKAVYTYDSQGNLASSTSNSTNAEGKLEFSSDLRWTWSQDGKLSKQTLTMKYADDEGGIDTTEQFANLTYDSAGRIAAVESANLRYVYTYDEAGNNTKVQIIGLWEDGQEEETGEFTFTYEPIDTGTEPQPATGFVDVPADAYYKDAVDWAVAKDVTAGTSATTFSPNRPCTRAQVVTFLWRAMGEPAAQSAGTFTDVSADSYYAKAVDWAVEKGITAGTSKTAFSPDQPCTRAQVVTFLWRAMDKPQEMNGADLFTDVPADSYFFQAVQWAVNHEVTEGTSKTTFSPNQSCTRAQVVTFLYRALGQEK